MFTGLVEGRGTVAALRPAGVGARLEVAAPWLRGDLAVGDSVAVNGCCLTVASPGGDGFAADLVAETLRRTALGALAAGDPVNLERPLPVGGRLGGHVVQGHVDGLGHVAQRLPQGEWLTVWFRCPPPLAEQMVSKGSVAVDGVSLTLVDVEADRFSVALIPHTLAQTTLGFKGTGAPVNLETDLLAKYVWKCLRPATRG